MKLPSQFIIFAGSLVLGLREKSADRDQFHGLLFVWPAYISHVLYKCKPVEGG
jgi:hypothetical protein